MRARSIKPGLLANEVLGTADPLYTILFEALWMMADREGRLEDRPLRIKAQAFPYRDVNCDAQLSWLAEHQFITRYIVDGNRFIQVSKFSEHQHPHVKEPVSKIPAPDSPGAQPVPAPDKSGADTSSTRLTPSSLTADSGLRTPDNRGPGRSRVAVLVLHESLPSEEWEQWLSLRRKRRWPVDDLTLRKQLDLLKSYETAIQRQIINASINAGWQGLFAPKGANGRANQDPAKLTWRPPPDDEVADAPR